MSMYDSIMIFFFLDARQWRNKTTIIMYFAKRNTNSVHV